MNVVPVIDVAHGQVVRAVQGVRASYRPIETPLAPGSDPAVIARALLALHPFRRLYVADLDGIEGRGRNVHLVPKLSAALSHHVDIWIDAGTASRAAARAVLAAPVAALVVGTEGVETAAQVKDILSEAPERSVLSLDFKGDEFLGPAELLESSTIWPARVIVMTLSRVGADLGPDTDRVRDIVKRAGDRKVYAAGGVRHRRDLDVLAAAGARGALVASALHYGKISAGDLMEIAGR